MSDYRDYSDDRSERRGRGDKGSDRGDRGDRDRGPDDGSSFFRKRARPPADMHIDYKDVLTLRQFVMEDGKMIPMRVNRLNRKQQNELATAIKRARHLAMLPNAPHHDFPDGRPPREFRNDRDF